jgi:hypothetical protein
MWLDFNPIRRTEAALDGIDPKTDQWKDIIDQTKLEAQYTLDFFGGCQMRLHTNTKTKKTHLPGAQRWYK